MSASIGKPGFLSHVLLGLAAAFVPHASLSAQAPVQIGGPTSVTSSAPQQTVTVSIPLGGTLDSIKVLTQGSSSLDFSNLGGGSCTTGNTYLPRQQCTVVVGFTPTAPGQRRGAIVLLDHTGTPIATQLLLGSATGPIATFIPGAINTVAGDNQWVYAGDGMPAVQASIFLPFGFALDAAGDLFIADSSNNRIRRVDAISGNISTIAGTGVLGGTGDGGAATSATISGPTFVALDPAGNIYFTDSGNNVIRKIGAFNGTISTYAGTMGQHGYSGDGGLATAATLNAPNGIAFDANGNLYITDTGNGLVRLVNAATGVITTVAGIATPSGNVACNFSGDGGPAHGAGLCYPWSVALDNTGELYIADQNNHRIRKVDTSGIISTIAGTGQAGYAGDNQLASSAVLNVPAGVAVDIAGNIYIADSGNNRVRKINAATGIITTVAGGAGEAMSGDGGPADQAGMYGPYGLALDGQGSLFIADVFHNRVRKVSSNIANLLYPVMRVNRISAPMVQTIENDGNALLNFTSVFAVSQAVVNGVQTTCVAGVPLAPLGTCGVNTSFAPTQIGTLVTGFDNVDSDSNNSPGLIVLAGQVLDTDPTVTSLTSTPNPSTTGNPVVFSVTVLSGGATPTGTVTLLDGTTTIATGQLQSGGNLTFTISTLLGGQHSLTASYGGDSSNAKSVSSVLIQTVQDPIAATQTSISSNVNPVIAGAPLVLTSNVGVATTGSGSGAITGTVTFKDGATIIGTGTLNNSVATLTITTLGVGNHTLTATYNGSSHYSPSTSASISETVQLATTHLTVSSSVNPSNSGAPVTLSASILGSGGVPTGPVVFMDGTTTLGSAPLNSHGIATLLVPGPTWTVGSHTITATYAGDAADSGSNSQPITQTVNLANTATALTSSLNPAPQGSQITFTASVTGNGGTPTGSVQFLDGTTSIGSAPVNAAGVATINTSTLFLGFHTITAVYAGDTYDATSTSFSLNQVIQQTTIGIALASSKNPSLFNDAITFSVTITGSGAGPTGTVTFSDGSTVLGTIPVDANGHAVYTTATLSIGTHGITAAYSGDVYHGAVTSSVLSQRVLQATTTTLASSTPRSVAGTPVQFTATLTGASGAPITGPLTISDGLTVLTSVTPDASGHAVYTTSSLAAGQHTIVATYAGDQLNAPSNSAPAVQNVDIASTAITLTTSANPINAGSPLTLSSTVTGNGATPTGNVTFHDGGTVLSVVPLTVAATATLTLSNLTPGIHQISASYGGDPNDQSSLSPTIAEQIAQLTTVSIASSANPSLLTDNITLTVTTANGVASAPPTGSITLTDGNTTIGTALINGAGVAIFTITTPTLGSHTFVASYAGDNANKPAVSLPLVQVVVLRPSSVTFTTTATSLSAGQQVVFVSVVQASGPRPTTGTVTFQSGATILGTAPIDASGVATLTLTPPQGLYAKTVAQYSGDTLYAPSTSVPPIAITVGPPVEFVLTVTPTTLSVQSGQHVTLQIAINANPSFTDTLAIGCAGLPASATCTFSKDQVPMANGAPQALTLTLDTGNPLGAGAVAGLSPTPSTRSLACILPAGAFLALFLFRARRNTRRLGLLAMLLLLAGSSLLSGCGSNFSQNATPAGSYTFQVVATADKSTTIEAASVLLTVTK